MPYPPIETIQNNPSLEGLASLMPDITYSTATGVDLRLSIIVPWNHGTKEEPKRMPLIVFVQGSAWTFPNMYHEIPQLSEFARDGYVVASVTHRNATEGHPFPAYLQDVKTAIRFLRTHADEYGIDPQKVAIWGTSSGGNTAMLVGLTPDDPQFKTDEYADVSDAVQAVVQCFGPTDIPALLQSTLKAQPDIDIDAPDNLFYALCGGPASQHPDVGEKMSPIRYIDSCPTPPPFLMLQGDADPVVPYAQCTSMYEALCDAGVPVQMVRVAGAPHEGSFWSQTLLSRIHRFLDETVGK